MLCDIIKSVDNDQALSQRIERAKELLRTVKHAAIATVNEDGSPHNSPVFMAFDDGLGIVWASSATARHSKNIARTGQAFIVLFDAFGDGGGLYIQAKAQEVESPELAEALATFNNARERLLRETLAPDYFTKGSPQRLYCARPEKLWVNLSEKDQAGYIIRDARYEVTLDRLTHAVESKAEKLK